MMHDGAIRYDLDGIADAAGKPAVGALSLHWAAPGDVCTLIGETGGGKSLVAQSILGLLPSGFRAAGKLAIAGETIALDDRRRLQAHWARTLSLVPQEPGRALDPTMRVRGQLRQVAGANDDTVHGALAELGLPRATGSLYPFELSGGMAQRALFAAALLSRASLIVADEPTKGLDETRAAQSLAALTRLRWEGRSLLVITHDLKLARRLGGQTVVMKEGSAVEAAPAAQLFAAPRHDYARSLIDADPSNWPKRARAGASPDTPIAEARGLAFGYGPGEPLFQSVSFTVASGEVVAIAGDSGSGKTTLGNILLGLRRPGRGSILWDGQDIHAKPRQMALHRRRYQKLHQDPGSVFARHRTIGQHFLDLLDILPPAAHRERLNALLDRMKLRPALLERTVEEISGGEAQRLSLARILMLDPALIVADEPSSRLDPLVQRDVFDLLADATGGSVGLVLISHDKTLVHRVADKVVQLAG